MVLRILNVLPYPGIYTSFLGFLYNADNNSNHFMSFVAKYFLFLIYSQQYVVLLKKKKSINKRGSAP